MSQSVVVNRPKGMTHKISIPKRFYAAAVTMEASSRGLPKATVLLIKLRASFLNNCRFCIDMHTKEALKIGFSESRISDIREGNSDSFTADEQLILEFTTAGTMLPADTVDDSLRQRVDERFGAKQAGELVVTIATINMWNRIGVLSGK